MMCSTALNLDEYERRLTNAQRLMAENKINGLLISTYGNFQYFTGYTSHRWMQVTAPLLAIVPLKGRPVMLLPAIELGRASTNSWITDIRPIRGYTEIGVVEICDTLADLKLDAGTIGVELGSFFRLGISAGDLDAVRRRLPRASFVDASNIFWSLRVVKSDAEIKQLECAVKVTDRALTRLLAAAYPGMTERQIFQTMAGAIMTEGADWPGSIPVGSRSPDEFEVSNSHLRLPTDRIVQEGDIVWLDAGCIVNGYWSDFMRMFCVGQAALKWKSAYRFIHEALHASIEQAKPGAPVSNAIAVFEKMLRASPYVEAADRLRTARIAHGIGLDLIEPPSMSYADSTILKPGFVLTIEPSIYLPEIGFFMLEEDVLITETGNKILSDPAPAEIPELG
jgi:Xaa-Pro dipeptidase